MIGYTLVTRLDPVRVEYELIDNNTMHPMYQQWIHTLFPGRNIVTLYKSPFNRHRQNACFDQEEQTVWQQFFDVCRRLLLEHPQTDLLVLECHWDPIHLDDHWFDRQLDLVQQAAGHCRVICLSSRCKDWYCCDPRKIWSPWFLIQRYTWQVPQHRPYRFGYLNRRNTPHRTQLFYTMLQRTELNHKHDSFSFQYSAINMNSITHHQLVEAVRRDALRDHVTHPDGFGQGADYSLNHPAWSANIIVVTETLDGHNELLSEKTAKAIGCQSPFVSLPRKIGLQVLTDLGFEPDYFNTGFNRTWDNNNVTDIVNFCCQFPDVESARDFRETRIPQITHNYHWAGFDVDDIKLKPWWSRYYHRVYPVLKALG